MIVWLKAHENENAKAWEDESALFSRHLFFMNSTVKGFWNASEIVLILMTFVLASCLIFNIEACKKHVLVH